MKHIKQFNESITNEERSRINGETKFGYYDMANAYMPGLIEDLKILKEEAGNYVSFTYEYDPNSNFCKIEIGDDKWLNRIIESISKHEGYREGWDEELTDDALVIRPMRFH